MLGIAVGSGFTAGRPYLYVTYVLDAPPGGTAPFYNDGYPNSPAPGANDACPATGRLSRIEVGADSRMVGAENVLIGGDFWCFQATAHAIDDVVFGPDGALSVPAGEGGVPAVTDYGQQTGPAANACGDPPLPVGAYYILLEQYNRRRTTRAANEDDEDHGPRTPTRDLTEALAFVAGLDSTGHGRGDALHAISGEPDHHGAGLPLRGEHRVQPGCHSHRRRHCPPASRVGPPRPFAPDRRPEHRRSPRLVDRPAANLRVRPGAPSRGGLGHRGPPGDLDPRTRGIWDRLHGVQSTRSPRLARHDARFPEVHQARPGHAAGRQGRGALPAPDQGTLGAH